MRPRRVVPLALLAALLLAVPARAVIVDRIVATVDGAPITSFELERFIRMNARGNSDAVTDEDREKALDILIGETLVRLESRRLGLSASKEDVDRYIAEIKRANNLDDAALEQALGQQGFTIETYKAQVAKELVKNQLVTRQIRQEVTITPAEIQKYYDDHIDDYAHPAAVHLRQIFFVLPPTASEEETKDVARKTQAAIQELDSGKTFAQVARELSEGPEASDGGDLGWMRKGQMIPELEQVALSLKKGKYGPPLRTGAGVHLLFVEDIEASEHTPLDQVRDQIQERLYADAVQERFQDYVEKDLLEGHAIVKKLNPPTTAAASTTSTETITPPADVPTVDDATTGTGDQPG